MTTASKKSWLGEDAKPPRRTRLGAVILDRAATRADLYRLPRTWRGEILDGTLYAFPRPPAPHQLASGMLFNALSGLFDRRQRGPGGWWVIIEPGIELPAEEEISPDIVAWKRERLPRLPGDGPLTTIPDWACEVISPATRSYDHLKKRRYYAKIGVPYLWYVDPLDRTLAASKLEGGRWVELGIWGDDETFRVEPFEAIEVSLSELWEGVEDEPSADDSKEVSPSPPSSSV